ncbi:hypothetical protein BKA62DRAFT_683134 [Auriculariales sp. MPI-PUGE-AT-0066]|nr:hypothetical protein BKA62DRAFT_683134 [Auriculariales sp. MPI-PUGE-AT-0066]
MASSNHFRTLAYAFFFTSMAINLSSIRARRSSDRESHDVRCRMVQELVTRLRNGEHIPLDEIERTKRLAGGTATLAKPPTGDKIPWREVFFGHR